MHTNNFCIATFCIFEKYRKIARENIVKYINKADNLTGIVLTDQPSEFNEFKNIVAYNMNEYVDTRILSKQYNNFDFSIKRFALKKAFELGYKKILLCDCDSVIRNETKLIETINLCNTPNTIYPFSGVYKTDYNRFKRLRKHLDLMEIDLEEFRDSVPVISEDLQQLFYLTNIDEFIYNLNKLENIKLNNNMSKIPKGILQEIALSAFLSDITLSTEYADKLNTIGANHDKWYTGYSKNSILKNTKYVSCIYGNNHLFNGHTRKDLHFLASSSSVIKHMNDNMIIYSSYHDNHLFSGRKEFNGKVKNKELNDYFFSERIKNQSTKKEYDKNHPRRSLHVQWAKISILEEEMKDMLDDQKIYWMDAGLAYPGLFPPRYNPNMEENEKFIYTNDNIFKNHDFSLLLNSDVAVNIAKEEKILVLRLNVPIKSQEKVEGTAEDIGRIIGGFFGGTVLDMKIFISLFKYKLNALLENDKYYSEESIMTYIVDKNRHLFNIKSFDTWHYPNSTHGKHIDGQKSFYNIFEDFKNADK